MFRQSLLRDVLVKKVLLTLKSGEAFSGLLKAADKEVFVLVNAYLERTDDQRALPVDGALFVLREDVAYIQVLSGVV